MGILQNRTGAFAEKEAMRYLAEKGFWVHYCAKGFGGQPCDIIAIKDDMPYLLDVKHCAGYYLGRPRIEPNQQTALALALKKGVTHVGFLCISDLMAGWRFVPFNEAMAKPRIDLRAYEGDNIE